MWRSEGGGGEEGKERSMMTDGKPVKENNHKFLDFCVIYKFNKNSDNKVCLC